MNTFFLNNITIFEINKKYELSKLKVCICTLGKDENRYIREFVEYYKNYGVDKIYLYDNNDINGEKFESVISQYINNKFVEIINWRGMNGKSTYYKIIDSCYQTHHNYYDWLIFYEIHMSDNNNLFYENKTLNERFPNVGKNIVKNKRNKICYVKSIIRGHLKNIKIKHNHLLNKKLKACNGFGEKSKLKKIRSLNPDYKFNYIKHYYGKSVQEFVEKIYRGDLIRGYKIKTINWAIEKFFYINKITDDKIEYIQKHIGNKFNLTKYKCEINYNP